MAIGGEQEGEEPYCQREQEVHAGAANAAQGRAWMPGLRDGEETVYAVLPLFHAYGLTLCLTFSVSIGATLVLFPRFDLEQVLEAIPRRPVTFLPAVPPVYERLATAARERGLDLTAARFSLSGAMALPPETVELWESVTGGLLVEGYGMTETSPVALGNPASPARRPGTVGVPFPSTDIRIVDPEDPSRDREPGEAGELLIRGPQVTPGYIDQAMSFLPSKESPLGYITSRFDEGDQRSKSLLAAAGFPLEKQDRPISELSFGQRARLGLLAIRLLAPNFYLLDEPTNHVDIPGQERLEEEILTHGATCFLVPHDRSFVRGLGNRFFLIENKRFREVESPEPHFSKMAAELD